MIGLWKQINTNWWGALPPKLKSEIAIFVTINMLAKGKYSNCGRYSALAMMKTIRSIKTIRSTGVLCAFLILTACLLPELGIPELACSLYLDVHLQPLLSLFGLRDYFLCQSLIEVHNAGGFHYRICIWNENATRYTATQILRKKLEEWDGWGLVRENIPSLPIRGWPFSATRR